MLERHKGNFHFLNLEFLKFPLSTFEYSSIIMFNRSKSMQFSFAFISCFLLCINLLVVFSILCWATNSSKWLLCFLLLGEEWIICMLICLFSLLQVIFLAVMQLITPNLTQSLRCSNSMDQTCLSPSCRSSWLPSESWGVWLTKGSSTILTPPGKLSTLSNTYRYGNIWTQKFKSSHQSQIIQYIN